MRRRERICRNDSNLVRETPSLGFSRHKINDLFYGSEIRFSSHSDDELALDFRHDPLSFGSRGTLRKNDLAQTVRIDSLRLFRTVETISVKRDAMRPSKLRERKKCSSESLFSKDSIFQISIHCLLSFCLHETSRFPSQTRASLQFHLDLRQFTSTVQKALLSSTFLIPSLSEKFQPKDEH